MRLTFVIHALSGGGAERFALSLASECLARGDEVRVVTLTTAHETALPDGIAHVGLALSRPSTNPLTAAVGNLRRARSLRSALRATDPDVIVAFLDTVNILTLIATIRLPAPVVVCERTDPRHHRLPWAWSVLRRMTYRRAACVVVQTEAVRDWAKAVASDGRVEVIPNFALPVTPVPARPPSEQLRIIGLGRLSWEKGFDLLIQAFHACAAAHPDWDLAVYGDGPERHALESLVSQLGLAGRVLLPGSVGDAEKVLRRASIFVLPSRYEGFPNALLEAMASGLAVVSFDCPSGPAEIIRDGVDGFLVPPANVPALAVALDQLMSNPRARRDVANRAVEVSERFDVGALTERWRRVFAALARP